MKDISTETCSTEAQCGGISVARLDMYAKKITVAGWFLGPTPADRVLIGYGDNIVLGRARLGQPRPDVHRKYPQYNNPNPGFDFEAVLPVDFCPRTPLKVDVFGGDQLMCTYRRKPDIDDAVKNEFDRLLKTNRVYFNYTPGHGTPAILEGFQRVGTAVHDMETDFDDYRRWMGEVDYGTHFPAYVREFAPGRLLNSKSLQHYLSIKMLDIGKKDICLDVASSSSVFPDILARVYRVKKSYRQDWLYRPGVHGLVIGSNAVDIPLPDGSVNKIALHCSWEHFEYDADVQFVREAHRLLKKNGKLCIIPLYMAEDYFLMTSPAVWTGKYRGAVSEPPKFEEETILCINDEFRQRQARYYDPVTLYDRVLQPLGHLFRFRVVHIANHAGLIGCPVFALEAERT